LGKRGGGNLGPGHEGEKHDRNNVSADKKKIKRKEKDREKE
jgi:hypothetical protein